MKLKKQVIIFLNNFNSYEKSPIKSWYIMKSLLKNDSNYDHVTIIGEIINNSGNTPFSGKDICV